MKALEQQNIIQVHYGHFKSYEDWLPDFCDSSIKHHVRKTEEKGSDVNLATHLLNDAWLDDFDCTVVVSNDSDLKESMFLVKQQFPSKKIGLISTVNAASKLLKEHCHFQKFIRPPDLAASQFPNRIPRTNITKPNAW